MEAIIIHALSFYQPHCQHCHMWLLLQMSTKSMICVCVLLMTMSPAKMAESINMSFGKQTRVNPKNNVLDGGAYGCHD